MTINENFLAVRTSLMGHGLKAVDILIAAKVQEFCINGLECYITNESFSNMYGESVSTIRRSIERLIKLNILKKSHGYIGGYGKSNYRRTLKMLPMPEWKIEIEESDTDNGSVEATDNDNGMFNMSSPTEQNTDGVFTESSPTEDGVFKNDEWGVHIEQQIDNRKDNRLEIDNSTPNGDSTANAATNLDTSAYTMKFVNQISDERCIELSKELTRNYTSSGGEFYIKLNTLRTKYGAEPKKHIDFETLYKMANSRARDIENQKRLKAEQGRELNSITTEEAASILSEVLGDYESKVSYTPLNEPKLNIDISETYDVKNHLVDCIGIRSNDVFDSEKDIPRFLVRRAYGVE